MTIAATIATVATAQPSTDRQTSANYLAYRPLHRCQLTAGYPTLSLPRGNAMRGSDSAAASIRHAVREARDRRVACALLGVLTVRPALTASATVERRAFG